MGRHSRQDSRPPVPTESIFDPLDPPMDEHNTLGLSPKYSNGGYRYESPNRHEFETWWEDYVTAPVDAANKLDVPTKVVPLTVNMPDCNICGGKCAECDLPEFLRGDVNLWKIFAYIVGICLTLTVVFYVIVAVLSIAFVALLVGFMLLSVAKAVT